MDYNSSDNASSSRHKRVCKNINHRAVEKEIERLLLESDDENVDYSDSGSEYFGESDSDSSSTSDIENEMSNELNLEYPETITTNNTWTTNKIDFFTFNKQPGLFVPISRNGKPIDFFFMLFDENLIELLVREINSYAESEFLRIGVAERSRIFKWKPMYRDEIITFIGLTIHTGTIKLNGLNDYWKKHNLFNLTCFSDYMSRDRFLLLLRCFHFAQNPINCSENIPIDRLYKIRPLIKLFQYQNE